MAILSRVFWTGLKVGTVGAVLKLSYDCDIWSLDPTEGARKLTTLKETVIPGTIVFPKEVLPCKEMCSRLGAKWNNTLDKVFSAVRWPTS